MSSVMKGGIHIHHLKLEVFLNGYSEKDAETAKSTNRNKCFIKIDSLDLGIASDDKSTKLFHLEDPLGVNWLTTLRNRNQFPCVVLDERDVFRLHGLNLFHSGKKAEIKYNLFGTSS